MILLTHPTGNTFSRALLRGLEERGLLGFFATTFAARSDSFWLKALPGKLRRELLRREYALPDSKLITRPARELVRLAAERFKIGALTKHEHGFASFDAIYHDLDSYLARALPDLARRGALRAVYAYEMGAIEVFEAARELGLRRFYELPIAYWETSQRLLAEEAQRWPQWKPTLLAVDDSPEKCARKKRELELAELVVCPSQFVRDSIPESLQRGRQCVVAEFGTPPQPEPERAAIRADGRLRVLFAGSMTQRKGLADVFAAMKALNRDDVELVVVGSPLAPMEFYRGEYSGFRYEPTRPHAEMLELMRSCDVLTLPSIVEGRALVQQEAMAQGLPLIATANAGAQDLIDEGATGFLVPIRSPAAIAERIAWFADNRKQLPTMRHAAWQKATALTWERYANRIITSIESCFAESNSSAAPLPARV